MPRRRKTHPAVRLTLGGAPASPHVIVGLPGYYMPNEPTPVGGDGELSVEEAHEAAAEPGMHLEVVDVAASEIEAARARQKTLRTLGMKAAGEARRRAEGAQGEQGKDQNQAATAA